MIAADHRILTPDTRQVDWTQPVNWRDPLNDGLVSWWLAIPNHTAGTSTWRDLCGLNDGTLTNFANVDQAWKTQGQAGGFGALEFDGTNDQVDVSHAPSLDIVNEITVTCWVRLGATGRYHGLIAKGTWEWDLLIRNTGIVVWYSSDLSPASAASTVSITDTIAWHFVAISRRGTVTSIMVDGVPAGDITQTGSYALRNAPVAIGSESGSSYFDGDISDVRIWDRALTASEIQDYYHRSQRYYPGLLNRHTRRSVFVPSTGTTITPATLSISAALQGSPPVSSRTIEDT